MSYLVSPCCGENYNDDSFPISDCCSKVSYGETDLCSGCKEHAEFIKYECNYCNNWFNELTSRHEYEEQRKESIGEARWEGRREDGY
jgi:predicted amidophosphoribosyltransferase